MFLDVYSKLQSKYRTMSNLSTMFVLLKYSLINQNW